MMISTARCLAAVSLAVLMFACAVRPEAVPPAPGRLTLSGPSVPSAENLFLVSDAEITAYLEWPHFRDGAVLEWAWIAPDGTVFKREMRLVTGSRDRLRLPLQRGEAAEISGAWKLRVSTPGGVVAEVPFQLVEDADRWLALHAEHPHLRSQALARLCERSEFAFLSGHFSFRLSPVEQQAVLACLEGHEAQALAPLAEVLAEGAADEDLLALAYRIKRRCVGRLRAEQPGEQSWRCVETLLTSWDAPLLLPLLQSPDAPTRLRAVELLGRSHSPEGPVLLAPVFQDSMPEVRLAAIEALERLGTDDARSVLEVRLSEDPPAEERKRIMQALYPRDGLR